MVNLKANVNSHRQILSFSKAFRGAAVVGYRNPLITQWMEIPGDAWTVRFLLAHSKRNLMEYPGLDIVV